MLSKLEKEKDKDKEREKHSNSQAFREFLNYEGSTSSGKKFQ